MNEIANLCALYFRDEETSLAAALPMVRAVKEQLTRSQPAVLCELTSTFQELTKVVDDMARRRQILREEIARRLKQEVVTVRLSQVIGRMPAELREPLQVQLERVRRLAQDLVTTNHRLSLHVRIFLETYQRLLHDLTGTTSGSGRYSPRGKTESPNYRPLLQLHG